MKETIFFMTYKTSNNEGFKQEYFNRKKTLVEFHNWVITKQQEVETERKTDCSITSIQFIKLNY